MTDKPKKWTWSEIIIDETDRFPKELGKFSVECFHANVPYINKLEDDNLLLLEKNKELEEKLKRNKRLFRQHRNYVKKKYLAYESQLETKDVKGNPEIPEIPRLPYSPKRMRQTYKSRIKELENLVRESGVMFKGFRKQTVPSSDWVYEMDSTISEWLEKAEKVLSE